MIVMITHHTHVQFQCTHAKHSHSLYIIADCVVSVSRQTVDGDMILSPLPNKQGLTRFWWSHVRFKVCYFSKGVHANPWPPCTTSAGCSFSVFRRKCFPFLGQWMPPLSLHPPSCVRKPPSLHSPSLHKLNLFPPPPHTGKETYRAWCFDSGSVIGRSG